MKENALMKNRIKKLVVTLLLGLSFLFFHIPSADAQRAPGDVGIGVVVGQPTGLSLKIYQPRVSTDFLAAWDWDDFFFLNIHALFDASLNDAHTVHFFYGPGGFIGFKDQKGKNKTDLGVSGNFGLDFLIRKFEIFLQATPRLSLKNTDDFNMGGGVGFRFYF